MRISWILFGLILAMAFVMAAIMLIDEPVGGHGFDHADYEHLDQGGSGASRQGAVLWLGWTFGVLQITFFVTCLAFAVRRDERLGHRKWPFWIGGLLYAAIFTLIVVTYHADVGKAEPQIVGAFPAATAVMLYGLWPIPCFFMMLYVLMFDRWVITPDDLERFHDLVEARRRRDNATD